MRAARQRQPTHLTRTIAYLAVVILGAGAVRGSAAGSAAPPEGSLELPPPTEAIRAVGGATRAGIQTNSLLELDYLIGAWKLRSFLRNETGEFVEADYTTSYRARLMYDGLSILAEFYGESRDGFYGVHLISRASETELVHYYLNARAGRRLEFRGRIVDGEYHLSRAGGYGGGDFLYREIDSQIEPDSFTKRIYESGDGGETWVEGDYYFRFERVAESAGG